MGDPFLNYFALFLLIFVIVVLFYGIIAIHDVPHMIAEARHHPHQDAIYAAGWVSLFTLHALWPFLWIWAMAYRPDRGWGFADKQGPPDIPAEPGPPEIADTGPPEIGEPGSREVVQFGLREIAQSVSSEIDDLKRRMAELEVRVGSR